MSIIKKWELKETQSDTNILQYCENSKILTTLLLNRGINTPEKINNFLNPLKAKLSSPDVFCDMEKSVIRIKSAIEKNEHITIYGDFDADGITSTSLLYLTLKEIGANVDYYLPDRDTESHGLNTKALVQIISKRKSKLIITVDCGISNVSEIAFAKGFKVDVIITDHHEAPEILPEAYAIINPKAINSVDSSLNVDELQSLNYLAGVGVAFKLSCKLLQEYNKEDFVYKILPLAAVGTIGDVVELIGENRSLVAMGLELIKNNKNKAISEILKSADIKKLSDVTAENIAFAVVPRLNAAGRLESPDTAIKLLITENDDEIKDTIKVLNDLNTLRQKLCEETVETAEKMYLANISDNKKSIILFNENWHIGIIGIVSSKLVEKYNKPVFLMTKDTNFPNIIRCSCRSITELNIHSILSEYKDIFEGFGGHKMAAGFSFDENKITFDKFKKMLSENIEENSQNINFNETQIDFDMFLEPDDITPETINLIEEMQPFGNGNPVPMFAINNMTLNNYKIMGQNNNHIKLFVSKNNSKQLECIKWNCPNFNIPVNSPIDILFTLKLNEFNNNVTVQLMLEDIHSEYMKQNQTSTIKLIDHRKKKNIITQVLDFVLSTKKHTAVFIENPALIKQLNIPEQLQNKIFSTNDIPSDIEQLMLFEAPSNKDDFLRILKNSGANIVHLMNFNSFEIEINSFISKLSGMIKYSITNLDGIINLKRISKALCVPDEVIDCALTMLDDVQMIDLNKEDDYNYKISHFHPLELSKIQNSEMYIELKSLLDDINRFKNFYTNSTIEEIKEICV